MLYNDQLRALNEELKELRKEHKLLLPLVDIVDDVMSLSYKILIKMRKVIYDSSDFMIYFLVPVLKTLVGLGLRASPPKKVKAPYNNGKTGAVPEVFKNKDAKDIVSRSRRFVNESNKIKIMKKNGERISQIQHGKYMGSRAAYNAAKHQAKKEVREIAKKGAMKKTAKKAPKAYKKYSQENSPPGGIYTEMSFWKGIKEEHRYHVDQMEFYIRKAFDEPTTGHILDLTFHILSLMNPMYWVEKLLERGRDDVIFELDKIIDRSNGWRRQLKQLIKKRISDVEELIRIMEKDKVRLLHK